MDTHLSSLPKGYHPFSSFNVLKIKELALFSLSLFKLWFFIMSVSLKDPVLMMVLVLKVGSPSSL